MNRSRILTALLSLFLLAALSGCMTTSLFSKFTHRDQVPKATASDPAVRCLCLWEPAEGTGVDGKPARGVSGQIFFFTRNSVSSVVVEGDVKIFLFDDQGDSDQQSQALHEFDFVNGSWKAHLTGTQFGPAYQLFVPYSRKGRHQAELALRVRLTPTNGSPMFSDIARVVLPGYERKKNDDTTEPIQPDLPNADDNESNDRITSQHVEQTMLQVLAERHNQQPSSNERLTPTIRGSRVSNRVVGNVISSDLRSQRPARRELAELVDEQDRQNDDEDLIGLSDPSVRLRLRRASRVAENTNVD